MHARSFRLRQARLSEAIDEGVEHAWELGNVARGQSCPCLAAQRSRTRDCQRHQRRGRQSEELKTSSTSIQAPENLQIPIIQRPICLPWNLRFDLEA